MSTTLALADSEIDSLRQKNYNAEVLEVIEIHSDLRILRLKPDWGPTRYLPGQYCVVGLGNWEPRVAGVQREELDDSHLRKVLKRAYSFSCPMVDDTGQLLPPMQCEYLEFYVVLVRRGEERPPGLTPRLFGLEPGDRLFVGPKVTGHYTLEGVRPDDDLVFIATGTGEAPHNAMVAELLTSGHRGRLTCLVCVRQKRDLGYEKVYRDLERRYDQLRYLTLTTREPENVDTSHPSYTGKRYIQDLFESGEVQRITGIDLDPARTHVFLCGNPAMIGAPVRGASPEERYPKPKGMIEILERRGFQADEPGKPGNVHFEKYW